LPIVWNGVTFTLASVGSQPMEVEPALLAGAGQHGVDSTVTMRLTVLRNTTMERHDTIVENALPVAVGGVTFGDSHADSVWTIANAAGCDSTITYSLHVWHNVTAEADSTLCEDALPLLWNGVSFTTDDTVTRNMASVGIHAMHGEDSTLTMRVHVLRNSTYTQRDTVIENNLPVAFCGVSFTTGVVDTTFVIANTAGCDSIVHYSLHVWRNYHHLFDSTVCDNQLPLTWCGADYSADLADYQTLSPSTLQQSQTLEYTSVHGADSTVTLVLTVHRTYEVNDAADICDGDTLYVAGTQGLLPLTEGGNYPVPLQSIHHCDSLVHLALTVHPVYLTAWFDTICDNEETTFDGQTVVVGGHYEVHHRTVAGCDSTLKMDLTVWNTDFLFDHHSTCHGISYIWENGVEYFTSTYEPTVTYANQHGCDSTRRLILDIDTSFQALVQATPMTVTYEHHNVRLADVSGGTSRIWYFPYITDTSQVTHYDYPMDQDSVEIMLVAVNWLGCVDSSVVVLRADRGILWPPNVFTPNESTNQVFFIPSYELASGEVWIYSRQGNLVAHFDALTGSWDGKKNGVLCPQASYMWVMRYTTKANPRQEQTAKGTVTLLK
ncbi:MAG: gliding motility-associated C-terminal domain-containing protein, partial [Bacteroidales bacterium]|nr:gliding motility-associated C-terminal domain-containing protein [Bacteroidales bacterium]